MPLDQAAKPASSLRFHRWAGGGIALLALLAGGIALAAADGAPERTPLPRFQGQKLGGGVAGTDQIGRRRALVYVFATRDRDADAIAGIVSRIAPDAARANIALVGVNRDIDLSRVPGFVERYGFEFPIIVDRDFSIARKLRIKPGRSALLLVDAEGFIMGGFAGLQGEEPDRDRIYEDAVRRILHVEKPDKSASVSLGLRPKAPNFTVATLAGERLRYASLRGDVVALVFFLPTCPHCHAALEFLQKLQIRLGSPQFHVVPVSLRNQVYVIEHMMKQQGIELEIYVDPDGAARRAYEHSGVVPDIVIIDRQGSVIARHRGMESRTEALLTMEVRQALGIENPLLLSSTGFSGEEGCRICHAPQHETWSLTTHAYAFDTLVQHGHEKDPECLACHTVGYGNPGGYSLETPLPYLEGVQCESCHGRGGPHQSPGFAAGKEGMRAACESCHNPKHSLNFAFAERLPLVSHAANLRVAMLSIEERRALLEERDKRERSLFQPGEYVGSAACQECHLQQYDYWASSRHARAFETLRASGKHEETDCVSCHVTGYGQQSGYPEGGAALSEVGCESCHGPGGPHVANGAPKKGTILMLSDKCDTCVVLQICGSCHTDEWSPNFEFELQTHIDTLRHGMQQTEPAGAE
jgi:peroxiredoxin/nitrate/TMAO reductase-like tetraheme cytochrome c subunit